jgi:hypothetical protein
MSRISPQYFDAHPSNRADAEFILREDPDEEDEEDQSNDKDDDEDNDDGDDGYSE